MKACWRRANARPRTWVTSGPSGGVRAAMQPRRNPAAGWLTTPTSSYRTPCSRCACITSAMQTRLGTTQEGAGPSSARAA
eukprot:5962828-Pyramimonas_sp.AAC.1